MADYIQTALAARPELAPINLYTRGGVPMPVPADSYPFVEIIIATEMLIDELTGGVSVHEYSGLITLNVQLGKQANADWLTPVGDKYMTVPSYDLVEELICYVMRELQKSAHHDMGGLTVTDLDREETVIQFLLDEDVAYGLDVDARTNNYENYGAVPFKVQTERRML